MFPPVVSTVLMPPLPVTVMLTEEDQGAVAPSVPPPKLKLTAPDLAYSGVADQQQPAVKIVGAVAGGAIRQAETADGIGPARLREAAGRSIANGAGRAENMPFVSRYEPLPLAAIPM